MNINEQLTTTVYLIIAFWSHRIRPFGSSNPHMVPMLEFKVGSRIWAFEEGAFDESWWITYESLWSNRFLRMGAGWEKREIYENIPVRLGRRWRSPWRTRHPKLAAAVKVWDPGDSVAGGQQLSYQLIPATRSEIQKSLHELPVWMQLLWFLFVFQSANNCK